NATQLITKGAMTQILNVCSSVQVANDKIEPIHDYLDKINDLYTQFGNDGFRVLGVCYKNITASQVSKDDETEMVFAGFVLLQDPLKEGLQDALDSLKQLQVNIKIITGDNKIVATSIGRKIGLANPVVMGSDELLHMTSEALELRVQHTDIFAEIEPQQKERIIQSLRKNFTVAYMGDGINDVAAINAADVGISVEDAVDVAKSAADFVLLEQDLMVLAEGIKEGRKTFINTLKYIFINTSATFGNMFSVAFASLMLPFLPMLPAQILLTNFLTDIPYLAISMDNVDPLELQQSNHWNIKTIRSYMVIFGLHSSIFDIATFSVLYFLLKVSAGVFQTGWFVESVLTELFILFIMRTKKSFLKSKPSKLLIWLSLAAFIFTIALPYCPFDTSFEMSPLPVIVMASVVGIVAMYIFTADLLKIWFFKNVATKY
ncbi:MAG TPA: HAD-IC family P-type ATPase, partial [Chitinophagaceae bacterium]|nr:HAD-IC family P-type ATPase [Chitinophagaceae bacterium]